MRPHQNGLAVAIAIALLFSLWLSRVSGVSLLFLYGLPAVFGLTVAFITARKDQSGKAPISHWVTALRLYYAAHLIWSSVRYWTTSMQPVIPDPIAGPFVESLGAMGIFPAIKTMEGLIGIMLLLNRYVPLALVLEMPTTVTIFYMNTFITATPHTVISGPAELAANCLLLLGYFQYYRPFLVAKADPAPPILKGEARPT